MVEAMLGLPVQSNDPEAVSGGSRDPFLVVRRLVPIRDGTRVSSDRDYAAPSHRVEVAGCWRPFAPDPVGRDPSGDPVFGLARVRTHDRHPVEPEKPHRIIVKVSVPEVREKAAFLTGHDPRRQQVR